MNIDFFVRDATEEMQKCAKCGACRAVCPVFEAEGSCEKFAARGKLSLVGSVLDGDGRISKPFKSILNNCLLCLACVKNCSSGVRVDKVVIAARALAVERTGQSLIKTVVYRGVLSHPDISNFTFKKAAVLQGLAFRKIPRLSGLRYKMPLNGFDRYMPAFKSVTFRESLPERIEPEQPDGFRETVVLFTGCSVNHLLPNVGQAAVAILQALKVNVIIPSDQGCCGAPVEAGGDLETVYKMAQQNIKVLSRYPNCIIITLCASGGYMLKKKYPEILALDEARDQASAVAGRTRDICEYLFHTHVSALAQMVRDRGPEDPITYHDPCHLVRGQGISSEPRALLNMISDNFREMDRPDRCCGSGGSYGISHTTNYHHILAEKIIDIQRTRSRRIATGCPACIIALRDGVVKFGSGCEAIAVRHTVEYLAKAMLPANRHGDALLSFENNPQTHMRHDEDTREVFMD